MLYRLSNCRGFLLLLEDGEVIYNVKIILAFIGQNHFIFLLRQEEISLETSQCRFWYSIKNLCETELIPIYKNLGVTKSRRLDGSTGHGNAAI